ncbi:Peroxisomal fatty acid beta-oxidation multifunctional protein MFP2 [Capsicum baccatum]|uniref:Peroxisomal fatty acid beta-oxidation multifunctional protein MFP2 n=1 Tax=Capsicum baccatum TaxID=33114 RepID=A0A2G2VGN1_CAPBA|nr:Peroxisomal fatty acid beta-oxidation multifunctional protein MFP2 [Capsicum baccatum]
MISTRANFSWISTLNRRILRCESCHGQAERLLDSAKEMEDSIAVNLSSRRLEVSRFELIQQVYETVEVLIRSGTCKALVHIFLSQRGTTKIPRVTDLGLVPRHVKQVAILGVGLMGSEIATVFLLSNYYMILKEVNDIVLEAGIDRIKAKFIILFFYYYFNLPLEKFVKALSLLKVTFDYETFRDVDMVIENIAGAPMVHRLIRHITSSGPEFYFLALVLDDGLSQYRWPVA